MDWIKVTSVDGHAVYIKRETVLAVEQTKRGVYKVLLVSQVAVTMHLTEAAFARLLRALGIDTGSAG